MGGRGGEKKEGSAGDGNCKPFSQTEQVTDTRDRHQGHTSDTRDRHQGHTSDTQDRHQGHTSDTRDRHQEYTSQTPGTDTKDAR